MKNTDLHMHSHYSDGQLSPKELVSLAKKRGIKNLALTDHNSVKGVEEAVKQGKKMGVNVIPAVEVGTNGGEVLGYFIDIKNKKLIDGLRKNSQKIEERVRDWCNKLNKNNYNITFKEIRKKYKKVQGNINEFHVLYTLHLKGYGTTKAIARVICRAKRLRPKKIRLMTTVQAIKLIKQAGGTAVLPHPWLDKDEEDLRDIKKLVKSGLKGLEINNGDRAPLRSKKIVRKIKSIAKKYNLILTSGSDYHGEQLKKQMPGNHNLGANNCDEKVVKKLKKFSKLL